MHLTEILMDYIFFARLSTYLVKKTKSYQDILDLWQSELPNHYALIGFLSTEEFQTSLTWTKTFTSL